MSSATQLRPLSGTSRAPAGGAANDGKHVVVQVLARSDAARDTITLLLAVPGTRRAPAPYRPGQFITLRFPTSANPLYRSYSLCGDGSADRPWEITVKRQEAGVISTYLHHHAHPSMLLRASLPQGRFTLPAAPAPAIPLVFVAGGSGITPIYAMLCSLAALPVKQRPHVWLHYAYSRSEDAIYGRELAALDPGHQWLTQNHYVSAAGGRLRPEQILASLGARARSAEWYLCGPTSLSRAVHTAALGVGVPETHLHAEVFTSPVASLAPAAAALGSARVRLAGGNSTLIARPRETLLETLERHGYRPDFECRAGACGTCKLRLLAGQVQGGDGGGLTPAERAAGYVLSCSAVPTGDVTLAAPGLAGTGQAGGRGRVVPAAHRAARHKLRRSLVAAAAALFVTTWGVTSNTFAHALSSISSSVSSNDGSSSQGSNGSNGSSSISTSSGVSQSNTTSGVS
jgi:ferredoxin-NADP reductase